MSKAYKRKRLFHWIITWIKRSMALPPRWSCNRWFTQKGYSFYLRFGRHYEGGQSYNYTIELCNLTISDDVRGSGLFTMFVEQLEAIDGLHIFVENVLQERFREFWRRRGYVERNCGEISCFFREAKEAKDVARVC